MTLRTLGRGFWIGLVGSIGLHAALLSTGTFTVPELTGPRMIEARLETRLETRKPDADSTPLPKLSTRVPKPPPSRPAETDLAAEPLAPEDPADQSTVTDTIDESPPPPTSENEAAAAPPLPDVEPPSPGSRPHAMLSHAASTLKELPGHVEIVYQLKGMVSGRQTQIWRRDDQRYTIESSSEATGLAAIFLSGRILQKSSGHIGPLGLVPERYDMQRPNGKKEILLFRHGDNVIEASRIDPKKGTRTTELPLLTGAQDPLSSIFQLAMVAREDGEGVIVAAGAKRIKGYPYLTLGVENIQTPLGKLQTLHVTRAGDSDKGAVHLWLAIEHRHLPVRITYTDDDGAEWVLEAVSLKVE
jgi:hypothetical protein